MENPDLENKIAQLEKYIPEKSREELEQLLAYGERMKIEGEKLRQEFRENYTKEDFLKLLKGIDDRVEEHREYLNQISGLERERFIKEYLYDKIIYSGNIGDVKKYEKQKIKYDEKVGFNQWIKEVKDQLKPGIEIDLILNTIGDEGVEAISHIVLKEGVELNLSGNQIGDGGAKAIMENMELKDGVYLDLQYNNISNGMEKKIKRMGTILHW